jgi:hypothetical protein
MRLTSFSEKKFFEMIKNDSKVNLKDLCRKICRNQVFKILKRFELLQKHLNTIIFERTAEMCIITGLPIISLKFNMKTEIVELENKESFVLISVYKP